MHLNSASYFRSDLTRDREREGGKGREKEKERTSPEHFFTGKSRLFKAYLTEKFPDNFPCSSARSTKRSGRRSAPAPSKSYCSFCSLICHQREDPLSEITNSVIVRDDYTGIYKGNITERDSEREIEREEVPCYSVMRDSLIDNYA